MLPAAPGHRLKLTLPATAQPYPKLKAKRAFSPKSESGKGKNNKAHFRKAGARPVIDLKPHELESFKTTKSPKPYKYYNPGQGRPPPPCSVTAAASAEVAAVLFSGSPIIRTAK